LIFNILSFSIIKDEPGIYVITLGGFTVEFTLPAPLFSLAWLRIYWWLVSLAGIVIGVIIFLLIKISKHHPKGA
jgi:hypothetical protein